MIRRILHISDTHGLHRRMTNLPEADVIVVSGDVTMAGTPDEAMDFCTWLQALPFRHKIYIAGNHEACFRGLVSESDGNCHYLSNSGVVLEGVKFYGVPMFMDDAMSGRLERSYEQIPVDTDVLITHQPPFGILDEDGGRCYGDKTLRARLATVNPTLHLFGHIHNACGIGHFGSTICSNGAVVDGMYTFHGCFQQLEFPHAALKHPSPR